MAFCTNCGQQLSDGSKFCSNCGNVVNNSSTTQRKTVYDGEIYKCPNCGELLQSFAIKCPTCEYELRGSKGSTMIRDLALRLEKAASNSQRVLIVKSFPIPNTKEDIIEFMLLASTNFDAVYYAAHLEEEDISDAWLAKIEQCYQKAKLVFDVDDENFKMVQEIYDKIKSRITKEKTSNEVRKTKNAISEFLKTKSTIFKIVLALLVIFEISRLLTFSFAGIDIIFCALILWAVDKATNPNKKNK